MNIRDLENISEIMTKELSSVGYLFSKEMITKCKEHALPENLKKELENPEFIGIILEREGKIRGFVVGYARKSHCFLDYVWGKEAETKKALIKRFEEICQEKDLEKIETEDYSFMENWKLYEEAGYERNGETKEGNLVLKKYSKNITRPS